METWGRWNRNSINALRKSFNERTHGNGSCVEWIGAIRTDSRYGICRAMGKFWLAHRLAYTLYVGPIPNGMCVCHRCDNGLCVKIDHLFLGTQKDNILDMEHKGRSIHKSGEQHGRAKLTLAQVSAIRELSMLGHSQRSLANRFNVSRTGIRMIISNKTWANSTK